MQTLMQALMLWIALHTPLDVPQHTPHIQYVTQCELNQKFNQPCGKDSRYLAYYDPASVTIFLKEGWNANKVIDTATLVHELVHHMQYNTMVEYECMGKRELEAYLVQKIWLEENGMTLEDMKTNMLFIIGMSMCPGHIPMLPEDEGIR